MAEVIGTGAGTITSGQRKASAIQTARKVPQFLQKTVNISANVAPLTLLIREKLGNLKTVGQASYFHLETDLLPFAVTNVGAVAALATATTVTAAAGQGARVQINSVLKVLRTGELLQVSNVVTDTFTVTRGFAGTTIGTILDQEVLAILSMADTEGNTSPASITSEPNIKTNYTQTFRQAFELSGRDINTEVYGEAELARVQQDAVEALYTKIEKAFLFQNGVNSGDPTMTGGIEYWVTSNVNNVSGALTEISFNDYLRVWLRRNQQQKNLVIFGGELFCRALDQFGRDVVRYVEDTEVLGIEATGYRTAFGTVKIVRHGMMTPLGSDETSLNFGWQGYAIGVNLNNLGECVHRGRDLTLRPNIQTPDRDGKKWEYLKDCGLYVGNEKSHMIIKGVT